MASVTVNGPESALTAHAITDCIVATEEPGSMELNEEEEQDTMSKLVIMLMSISWTPAAALRTIVELDIPHILATQVDSMTAEEILQHVPAASKPHARNLERIMRLLTCKNVFTEEMEYITKGDSPTVVRRFALTPLSRVLVPGHDSGTMANFVKLTTVGSVYGKALEHLSDSILLGEDAFQSAHGMNEFQYMNSHPEHLSCFQAAMSDHANELVPLMLCKYQGFKGVRKLMDVGGGQGTILARIVSRHPHMIQGVNFDLPEVVATAPAHHPKDRVEHVGGDMFHSIPSGCDAIFMKSIMHDWNDEDCLKILRNCYNALPEKGKVIIVEALVPLETPDNPEDHENVGTFMSDFVMQVHCPDGRERHRHEFQQLVKAAGFSQFLVVVQLDYMFVMEGIKQS